MDPSRPHQDAGYDARQKRKSTNLLYILAILAALIVTVFSGLHFFGQRFGVPV
jgi:hypothetical protein